MMEMFLQYLEKVERFILIKNLLTNSLQFEDLPNNIEEILKENNYKLIGIRDLYFYFKIKPSSL